MNSPPIQKEILEQLEKLDATQQQRVLDFTRALAATVPPGVAGDLLLSFAGAIDESELLLMAQAIEEGCERVDVNGW